MSQKSATSSSKPRIQFRHEQNIYDFVEEKRKLENKTQAEAFRHIYNAGLQTLYKVKIVNNEIVNS